MINKNIKDYFQVNCGETCIESAILESFIFKIEKKGEKYYQRGLTAVREGRPIRSFRDACGIIERSLLKSGIESVLAEGFACFFAKCYRSGVESAQSTAEAA